MNDQIKYALVGILVGGVSVWLLTTTVFNSNYPNKMNPKSNLQSSSRTTDVLDAHFIEQMIPHHEDAITMAKIAQTKAQKPEVKERAENIISSQTEEINKMKDWYKNWFGKDVPAGNQIMNEHGMIGNDSDMHMGLMGDKSDITKLEQATDFDKAFVEEMIPHHQMAVMMANMLRNGTERSEMTKLADEIIAVQTSEIDQMRQWLIDWEK